jgi:hypothetical protein
MQIIEYFKSLIGCEINHCRDKWLFQNTMFHVPNGLVFGMKKTKEDNERQKMSPTHKGSETLDKL